MKLDHSILSRRGLLKAFAALPIAALVARVHAEPLLPETPEIQDADEPTPEQTEGPFYKSNNPARTSLRENGMKGELLVVSGRVLSTSGKPVAGALVDFWHCDADGDYDNSGYKFRGHQHADKDGAYRLETIVPGLYPGRTRHIHVRVQPPQGRILTTQLYFPEDKARNDRDGIFTDKCLMKMTKKDQEKLGAFDFVVRI